MKNLFLLLLLTSLWCSKSYSNDATDGLGYKISTILQAYSKNSGLKVIVSNEVDGNAKIYGLKLDEIDFDSLLTILKLNGYTAFKTEKHIQVVPEHRARIYVSEMYNEKNTYPDDLYLTDVIQVNNLCASSLMTVLMPLVFRHSFIGTQFESNSIVIVDYYSNIRKIKSLIHAMDSKADKKKNCERFEIRPKPPAKSVP